mgnify:CR=1 FL=1
MPLDGPEESEAFVESGDAVLHEEQPPSTPGPPPSTPQPEPHMVAPPFPPPFVPPQVIDQPPPEPEADLSFPPEHKRSCEGLLFLGQLKDTVHIGGHEIVIRTLDSDDILEVGVVTAPWRDTEASLTAFSTGTVGAAIVTIDGKIPVIPLTSDEKDTKILNQFNWARKLNPAVVERLYDRYRELEAEVRRILDAMGEARS